VPGSALKGKVALVSGARQGIGAALMLASDEGRLINGEAIIIDGGRLKG
jgi:hypothetical protein